MEKLRKMLATLLAVGMLTSCGVLEEVSESRVPSLGDPGTLTEIFREIGSGEEELSEEMRAVWIAYLDLAPLIKGRTEADFRESFSEMAENCRKAFFNTLVVQVRPFCDSFYPSEYFSWSSLVGGALSYDPLSIMTEIAKEKGLAFHGWINPMRGMTEAEIGSVPETFPLRQWYDDPAFRKERLILSEGRIYLNPGSPEVRKLIADGGAELARYGVDGVQIDDYFYPPGLGFSADEPSYKAYQAAGGTLSQVDWRRENTFRMVKELGTAVKAVSASILFGVSPRGQLSQSVEQLYFDPERCAEEAGCLDYLAPQLYYGFRNEAAPFEAAAEEWDRLAAGSGVLLIPGLAAYKVGREDLYAGSGSGEWLEEPDLLAREIRAVRELSTCGGVMLFRYGSIFEPEAANAPAMEEAQKTFFPALAGEDPSAG